MCNMAGWGVGDQEAFAMRCLLGVAGSECPSQDEWLTGNEVIKQCNAGPGRARQAGKQERVSDARIPLG